MCVEVGVGVAVFVGVGVAVFVGVGVTVGVGVFVGVAVGVGVGVDVIVAVYEWILPHERVHDPDSCVGLSFERISSLRIWQPLVGQPMSQE